jgi:transcriptional regulator MraZ
MLLGTHEHTLDDKNRLTLPARFRRAFADGVVVSRGMDGCLAVYPLPEWERMWERLARLDTLSAEARRIRRYFFSGAVADELDRQGRVAVPGPLKEYAKLDRDVVVAGVHDHLEIWDRAHWRRELTEFEGSAEDVAERLAAHRD